jgi:hypothetical protein
VQSDREKTPIGRCWEVFDRVLVQWLVETTGAAGARVAHVRVAVVQAGEMAMPMRRGHLTR